MGFFASRRRHTRNWRDWRSDVSSSDLHPARGPQRAPRAGLRDRGALPGAVPGQPLRGAPRLRPAPEPRGLRGGAGQIGRASWRERVEISVLAVSLKETLTAAIIILDRA